MLLKERAVNGLADHQLGLALTLDVERQEM